MNILFFNIKGSGHVNPTLPLAEKLVQSGHRVVYNNFAPWGLILARHLGYPPHICSISTLVPDVAAIDSDAVSEAPPLDRTSRAAVGTIQENDQQQYSGHQAIEAGFFAERNLVYSSRALNAHVSAKASRYDFVGPMIEGRSRDESFPLDRDAKSQRRRVYVSLGTIVGSAVPAPEGIFQIFIDAFGAYDAYELMLSIGSREDITRFADAPENVLVRSVVPQLELLQHTDLFITHSRANSVHEGLYFGVPQLSTPFFGDQPSNPRRVAELGAGASLSPDDISSVGLREAADKLLRGSSHRDRAAALSETLRCLGSASEAARVIESLCRASLTPRLGRHPAAFANRQPARRAARREPCRVGACRHAESRSQRRAATPRPTPTLEPRARSRPRTASHGDGANALEAADRRRKIGKKPSPR